MKKIIKSLLGMIISILLLGSFIGVKAQEGEESCADQCAIAGIEGKSACIAECEAKKKNDKKSAECKEKCCGIKLNTKFPIIGNCIEVGKDSEKNPTNAFPVMIGALTKIIMSVIFVVCFIFIIYAGILWASNNPKEGKEILKKVAITILLLGFSGVILRLINPNFFG